MGPFLLGSTDQIVESYTKREYRCRKWPEKLHFRRMERLLRDIYTNKTAKFIVVAKGGRL